MIGILKTITKDEGNKDDTHWKSNPICDKN